MIRYAITDPSFFNPYNSKSYLENLRADFLLFRDKLTRNYPKEAKAFINSTQNLKIKRMIHQDYILADSLKADGVHLTSNQFSSIIEAKRLNLFVVVSTHSIDEIREAKSLGADAVTFSPIFSTPNKGNPKGVKALKEAIECCDIKVIALGGIVTDREVEKISKLKPWGFASIRYFISK